MTINRLPQRFSIDTETGRCPDRKIKTVMIQICPVNASSEDDVTLFIGEDCYDQFLDSFALNDEKKIEGFLFNNKWEAKGMITSIISHGYEWVATDRGKTGSVGKMQWSCVADDKQTYSIVLRNGNGCLWKITDDYLKVIGHSMAEATEMVRKEYPDWFSNIGMEKTKLAIPQSMYNNWYALDEDDKRYQMFVRYAVRDSFSQAMLSRWMDVSGMHSALTSASNGLDLSLLITYAGIENLKDAEYMDVSNARKQFLRKHPVLERREQNIVEDSLLGGFVYGHVSIEGRIKGVFCHIDYKSSYPYEYVYGLLPYSRDGKPCHVYVKGSEGYERNVHGGANKCVWYYVSFKFRLKENRMPCISAESCVDKRTDKDFKVCKNKKMESGEVRRKLFTYDLYNEIKEHCDVWDEDIHEVWVAPGRIGEFADFIKKCFMEKERPELKGTLMRAMWKLFMNGGVHGKTITKTWRKRVTYPGNVKMTEKPSDVGYVPSDPSYCALIGFTAMQNARARLLKHCRMLLDAGYTIMMCDTDSIIVNTDEENVRRVLGDWFVDESLKGEDGIRNLGKFEFETNEDMLKREYGKRDGVWMFDKKRIRVEFDELSCGGLKEYAEYDNGMLRKSAMKGMHDDVQMSILPGINMGLGSRVVWEQKQKVWNGNAYEFVMVRKESVVKSIYYEEDDVKVKRKAKFKQVVE